MYRPTLILVTSIHAHGLRTGLQIGESSRQNCRFDYRSGRGIDKNIRLLL